MTITQGSGFVYPAPMSENGIKTSGLEQFAKKYHVNADGSVFEASTSMDNLQGRIATLRNVQTRSLKEVEAIKEQLYANMKLIQEKMEVLNEKSRRLEEMIDIRLDVVEAKLNGNQNAILAAGAAQAAKSGVSLDC